jgi:hypothetical protein
MNVEAFLLCDAATDQRGKLNVLGAFDNIFAQKMPLHYPACALAARLRFDKAEEGEHTISIHIMDQEGTSIGPKLNGKISVRVPDPSGTSVANLILNIQRLEFKNYGKYWIDLDVDGTILASLPLGVNPAPPRPGSFPQNPLS